MTRLLARREVTALLAGGAALACTATPSGEGRGARFCVAAARTRRAAARERYRPGGSRRASAARRPSAASTGPQALGLRRAPLGGVRRRGLPSGLEGQDGVPEAEALAHGYDPSIYGGHGLLAGRARRRLAIISKSGLLLSETPYFIGGIVREAAARALRAYKTTSTGGVCSGTAGDSYMNPQVSIKCSRRR